MGKESGETKQRKLNSHTGSGSGKGLTKGVQLTTTRRILETVNNTVNNKAQFYSKQQLKCLYTNADTLTNKMVELRVRSGEIDADIIMITEVKPKNQRYKVTEAELKLPGYDLYTTNIDNELGRGIVIYIRKNICTSPPSIKTKFSESCWVTIKLSNNESLIIGCMYRSPNKSDHENNHRLRDLIKEAYQSNASHLLITGDFNYPKIDWNTCTAKCGDDPENEEFNVLETIRDCLLHQHVTKETR